MAGSVAMDATSRLSATNLSIGSMLIPASTRGSFLGASIPQNTAGFGAQSGSTRNASCYHVPSIRETKVRVLSQAQAQAEAHNWLVAKTVQGKRRGRLVVSNRTGSTATGAVAVPAEGSLEAVRGSEESMAVVQVDLGERSYPIYIGEGLLDRGDLFQKHIKGKQVLVVTNETVAPLYLHRVIEALKSNGSQLKVETVVLPDGEKYKDLETLNLIFDRAIETRMDRRCTFVALGGGVIGDMCGFAAASYLRGVDFIQVPTTVMAQVDSSVGGKTGVNHRLGKNLIGAFYQPNTVVIDTASLATLPDRELASGLAEVVKYGLIRDADFFEWQERNADRLLARDPAALSFAIQRSCENKAAVVAADEKEGGIRATLNLGHTFGHAIENAFGYGEWLHGEAVAAGTIMAATMSHRLGWIDESLVSRTIAILEKFNLPTCPPPSVTKEQFRSLMAVDKKVADGKLRLILLKGPLGGCVFTGDFDPLALDATLDQFCGSK